MVDHVATEVQVAITASATCSHSEGPWSPRTPLSSGAEVLWSRTEAPGMADTMLEACMASSFGCAPGGVGLDARPLVQRPEAPGRQGRHHRDGVREPAPLLPVGPGLTHRLPRLGR